MYELYSAGSVSGNHSDFQDQQQDKKWEQRFSLQSAYSVLNEPITNYTKDFKGCIDYIWFTKGSMDLHSILDAIPLEELQKSVSLPTERWSSDHMLLACEFTFK